MRILKASFLTVAIVSAASFASDLSAATISLSKQNASDTFNGGGNAVVRVASPGAHARAGGFRLTDGTNDFVAWCLDITHYLSFAGGSTDYTTTDTPFSNTIGTFSAAVVSNIESLFETAYSTLDLYDDAESGGFQLALWEILYEDAGNSLSLDDGDFELTGGSAAAAAAANGYLANLNGPVTQSYAFTFYESSKNAQGRQRSQNLVSVSPVPLPAAAGLLGLGLFGLFGLRRSRKS